MSKLRILLVYLMWLILSTKVHSAEVANKLDKTLSNLFSTPPPTSETESVNDFKQFFWDYYAWSWGNIEYFNYLKEPGIVPVSPFPAAMLLANVNEGTFKLPTSGLSAFLHISKDRTNAQNHNLLVQFLNKGEVSTTSKLFTSKSTKLIENIFTPLKEIGKLVSSFLPLWLAPTAADTTALEKFGTGTETVDFLDEIESTFTSINTHVSKATRGTIDSFVPKGGWWSGFVGGVQVFFPWTSALFVNTNYYKSSWTTSWVSLGPKLFYEDRGKSHVPFMETNSSFQFYTDANYSAVVIPLKKGKKSLILIQPQRNVTEFAQGQEVKSLMKNSLWKSWNTNTNKTLQIPELQIVPKLGFRHDFEKLWKGGNSTFCPDVVNLRTPDFMGPIFQSHSIKINPNFFELASATSSTVNAFKNLDKLKQKSGKNSSHEMERQFSGKSLNDDAVEIVPKEEDVKETQDIPSDTIRFNKPFLLFLHDEQLGPTHFTLVNSFAFFKIPIDFGWLADLRANTLWNCPQWN